MLETIATTSPIFRRHRPGREPWAAWDYSRSLVHTWRLPRQQKPAGISDLRVTLAPDGETRVHLEGNLTAAVYGPELTWASLAPDELHEAAAWFLDLATQHAPFIEQNPELHDLTRFDPSATIVLDPDQTAGDIIRATRPVWNQLARKTSTVAHHQSNGETLRLSQTAGRSWEVYDKTADALRKGQRPDPGLLRVEARIRPRKIRTAEYLALTPTLALDRDTLETITVELDSLARSVQTMASTATLGTVRALARGGAPINSSMRLATVQQLVGAFGPGILDELGVPAKTQERWRAELRKYLPADVQTLEDQVIDDLPALARMTRKYARDVTVTPSQ